MFHRSAHAEHLRHELHVAVAERDACLLLNADLHRDLRAERVRNDRIKGENRDLIARLLTAERPLAG